LAHSDDPFFIAREYGIPVPLLRLAESIFERLPADEAPQLFAAFPDAIGGDGKDLHGVPFLFLAEQLRQVPTDGAMFPVAVQSALGRWADGLELMARNQPWRDYEEARAELAWVRDHESSSYGELCGSLCVEGDNPCFDGLSADMQRFLVPGLQRDLLLRLIAEAPYAARNAVS
jgi:hypothetical protein